MASLQNQSKNKSRDEKSVDSLVFLQAVSEMHLSEGRLGEAIQYIQELRRVARLTKQELTAITSQGLLDRCRRSTSGIETVHEEEAGISWNLALTFFADQLYQEAEGHANNAARLYTELGFETQALECDQFLAAIQDAMGSLLQPSYNKELPKLLLTHPERFRDPAPSVKDPIYECKKKRTEIVWFVAGALQCAPDPLTAEKIVSLIEKYHPGKIRRCKEAWDWSSEGTDTEFIEHVLSTLKAFEAHETFSGYWGLSKLDYLPPFPRKDLLCGYDNPSLGSIQPEEGDRFKFLVRSGLSKRRARDEKATSEKRLSEGRLGEGLKYIQEFRRIARLAKQELAAITSQGMLDRYRRSTSGVETVHEEEAGISWNLALTLFAGQLYQEAERHVINATRLYKELGFETQALECDQFLDAIQDAMGTPPQPPEGAARYNKDLPKLFLTCPRDSTGYQLPFAKAPIGFAKIRVEMVWFIA
ncbi:hypothetical protein FRC05_006794 [Tulasnella sp. 425]|nr:hypothetical protein FRC05_006794 [Tulasnella sp. 425]